jgi:hypothetical protein
VARRGAFVDVGFARSMWSFADAAPRPPSAARVVFCVYSEARAPAAYGGGFLQHDAPARRREEEDVPAVVGAIFA